MQDPTTNGRSDSLSGSAPKLEATVHDAADRLKEAADEQIHQGAAKAGASIHAAADAVRRAAGDVDSEHAWLGEVLRKGADAIENAGRSIEGGDVEQGLHHLSDFARRQPALFLGASFAAGYALSRVGKTAVEHAADTNLDIAFDGDPNVR